MIMPIAHYLLATVKVKCFNFDQIISWADQCIAYQDKPQYWLINLSLSKNMDEVMLALEDKLYSEQSVNGGFISIGNMQMSLLFYMHVSGLLPLTDVLEQAGLLSEGGFTDLEPDEIYKVLNLAETGELSTLPEEWISEFCPKALEVITEILAYKNDKSE